MGARGNDDNGNGSGSAYVYSVTTGAQLFKLTASDAAAGDNFGFSVDMNGQFAFISAVGDSANAGSIYSFNYVTGTEVDKFTASDAAAGDVLGWSVAGTDSLLIAGAKRSDGVGFGSDSGSAYIFAVPEPSAAVLLLGSGITLLLRRRISRRTWR